jgi:putative ABC transport system ATP-binding protein
MAQGQVAFTGPSAGVAEPLIKMRGICKSFQRGGETLRILDGLDFDVPRGSFEALMGPSGSGKSTLLNLIAGIDRPTSGTLEIGGRRIDQMSEGELAKWRSQNVGFVFQSYNLLPRTSALDNVATPLLYQGVSRRDRAARARAALERLGMGDRLDHEPTELSGGQQQRVAVARALVTEPALILADEPTGNLDSHAGAEVMALLHQLNAAGRTIVLITHDPEVARSANRQVHLRDGRIVA